MKQVGRLAMRLEGNYWNAYYALPDTMDKAVLLGSIAIGIVAKKRERYDQFFSLMQEIVADFLEEMTRERPDMGKVVPAPESERAGHG